MNTVKIPPAPQLKAEAKAAMNRAGKPLLVVALVYWGIDFVISFALQGTVPEDKLLLVSLLELAVSLLLSILTFGFRGLCLDAARGEEELPLSGLLAGTHLPLRVFGVTLLEGLLALFYGIPYVLAMVAAGLCVAMLSVLGILVAIPVYLWGLWGIMKIAARYSMAPFILWDRPEMPALDCLNLSRTMMEGHEGKYIWLELTFLGWILLGMVTWGIPMIWVNPYMQLTLAGFYRALGGDHIAFPHKPQPEEPETRDDLKDAFTTSAYRDQEDK